MNHTSLFARRMILALGVILFAACTPAAPTSPPAPPPDTQAPPTATQALTIETIIPSSNQTVTPPTLKSSEQNSVMPSPRSSLFVAYDSKRNLVLLFGGSNVDPCWKDCGEPLGDTWIYDITANTWTQIKPPTAPSGRANAAMAYDVESDRIILFAGFISADTYAPLDTWSFDINTKTWTQMKAAGPAYYFGHKLVYDSKADRMILWGGWNFETYVGIDDTWTYDYNTDTWTKMNPKVRPPGVNFQGMVYDSKADRVIMWGGGFNTSVWIYDYNTDNWEERKPNGGPSSRYGQFISYDSKADLTILYGGYTGDPNAQMDLKYNNSETWAYDYNLNTWTQLNPANNPGLLSFFGQDYVSSTDRLLVFGGLDEHGNERGQTWLYDYNANTWTEVTPKP
jgi:hypothetical protein